MKNLEKWELPPKHYLLLKPFALKIILFQIYTPIFYIPINLAYSFLKELGLLKMGLKKIGLELKTQCWMYGFFSVFSVKMRVVRYRRS